MTLVVGACAHGSPGVTTSLLLAASLWPDSVTVPVVVEADVTGGVLAARYEIGTTPGFVTLAESMRKSESPPLLDHAQRLPSGVAAVAISPSAGAAATQLRSAGPFLGSYLAKSDHPVMIDAGVVLPDTKLAGTLVAADLMVWFVRPTREELLVLRHRLAECPQPEQVGIVLVGSTPYAAEEVEEALEVKVLHTLPIDSRAATALNFGGDNRYLRRSQLARSCAALAQKLSLQTWIHAVGPDESDPPIAGSTRDLAARAAAVAEPAQLAEQGGARESDSLVELAEPEVAVWTADDDGDDDFVVEGAEPEVAVWAADDADDDSDDDFVVEGAEPEVAVWAADDADDDSDDDFVVEGAEPEVAVWTADDDGDDDFVVEGAEPEVAVWTADDDGDDDFVVEGAEPEVAVWTADDDDGDEEDDDDDFTMWIAE